MIGILDLVSQSGCLGRPDKVTATRRAGDEVGQSTRSEGRSKPDGRPQIYLNKHHRSFCADGLCCRHTHSSHRMQPPVGSTTLPCCGMSCPFASLGSAVWPFRLFLGFPGFRLPWKVVLDSLHVAARAEPACVLVLVLWKGLGIPQYHQLAAARAH